MERSPQPQNRDELQQAISQRDPIVRRFDQSLKLWDKLIHQDKQLFDNFHPFGFVFFNNQILKKENLLLFSLDIVQMMGNENWCFKVNSNDEAIMWQKRLSLMEECQATSLEMKKKSEQKFKCFIFNCMQHIGFPDLMKLDLFSCSIQNIEPLANLNAPRLMTINLIYNNVYTFKSLNKSNVPLKYFFNISTDFGDSRYNARKIGFKKPYARLENYSRWNFQLNDLRLEKHSYNSVGMNDLSFLAKSKPNPQQIQLKINIALQKRIKQNIMIQVLKKTHIRFEIFLTPGQHLPFEDTILYQVRN